MEKLYGKEEFYYGPEISETTIIPQELINEFFDAVQMEKGVSAKELKREGETYDFTYDGMVIRTIVPKGSLQIEVTTHNRSLDEFWNTFAALCEYDLPTKL